MSCCILRHPCFEVVQLAGMAQATTIRLVDVSRLKWSAGQNKLERSSFHIRPANSSSSRRTCCEVIARKGTGHQTRRPVDVFSAQQRAELSREAPPRCLSDSNPSSQVGESKAPARRTALLLAGAAFFSSLPALVADQSTAHAAPAKPPAEEEVPEIVKGECQAMTARNRKPRHGRNQRRLMLVSLRGFPASLDGRESLCEAQRAYAGQLKNQESWESWDKSEDCHGLHKHLTWKWTQEPKFSFWAYFEASRALRLMFFCGTVCI